MIPQARWKTFHPGLTQDQVDEDFRFRWAAAFVADLDRMESTGYSRPDLSPEHPTHHRNTFFGIIAIVGPHVLAAWWLSHGDQERTWPGVVMGTGMILGFIAWPLWRINRSNCPECGLQMLMGSTVQDTEDTQRSWQEFHCKPCNKSWIVPTLNSGD